MLVRCPICTDQFSSEDDERQAVRLAACGHVLCFGCLSRILEDGSASCPNRCNRNAEITSWLPLHLSTKAVANADQEIVADKDQETVAIDKRISELDARQVVAERRHIRSSEKCDLLMSQVQNQHKLIDKRQGYIQAALADLGGSQAAMVSRKAELLRLVSRIHRQGRLARRAGIRVLDNAAPAVAGPSSVDATTSSSVGKSRREIVDSSPDVDTGDEAIAAVRQRAPNNISQTVDDDTETEVFICVPPERLRARARRRIANNRSRTTTGNMRGALPSSAIGYPRMETASSSAVVGTGTRTVVLTFEHAEASAPGTASLSSLSSSSPSSSSGSSSSNSSNPSFASSSSSSPSSSHTRTSSSTPGRQIAPLRLPRPRDLD
ncbi:hypothetical protein TRAPUB_9389, partial [Trametes pubescens]